MRRRQRQWTQSWSRASLQACARPRRWRRLPRPPGCATLPRARCMLTLLRIWHVRACRVWRSEVHHASAVHPACRGACCLLEPLRIQQCQTSSKHGSACCLQTGTPVRERPPGIPKSPSRGGVPGLSASNSLGGESSGELVRPIILPYEVQAFRPAAPPACLTSFLHGSLRMQEPPRLRAWNARLLGGLHMHCKPGFRQDLGSLCTLQASCRYQCMHGSLADQRNTSFLQDPEPPAGGPLLPPPPAFLRRQHQDPLRPGGQLPVPWDVTLRNGFAPQQQPPPPPLDLGAHQREEAAAGTAAQQPAALPHAGAAPGQNLREAFYHDPSDPPVPRSRFAAEAGAP